MNYIQADINRIRLISFDHDLLGLFLIMIIVLINIISYLHFDLGQGGDPPRPAEVDLRWKAARGWKDTVRLQHPEGVYPPLGPQTEGRYADLRQDPHRQDYHLGGGA